MDKLSNDELIKIMIEMKNQYENQYKKLEIKFNSLNKFCLDIDYTCYEHHLINYGECNYCNCPIYKVDTINEFDNENVINDNYRDCSGCNKICCRDCLEENFIKTQKIDDNEILIVEENKFWCKKCNDFNEKMKELK